MCATLFISGTFGASYNVLANQELINNIQKIKEKKANIDNEEGKAEQQLQQVEAAQQKVRDEIKRIDLAVAETKGNIRKNEESIKETNEQIEQLTIEIEDLQERIEERDELLKERARSIQETGGMVSYLDVLLGAQNFSDFIDRAGAVSVIMQQDKDILREHMDEKELVEEKKEEVIDKKENLEKALAEQERLKEQFEKQKEEKNQIMSQLREQEEEIEKAILSLEEQKQILDKQEAVQRQLLKQWQEEERKRKEAAKRGEQIPTISDGSFTRPANGPATSHYGQRWGKLHAGIDIGKRGSDVPIVAAANGIVFRSYYSNSYGNVVFITHIVNGKTYTTVYAHMENRLVAEGQTVQKGQKIGYMGNTGDSMGAHLHFEIHEGAWNYAKSNSVDPRKYINF
ncbi:peptidase M23 [Bacillus solimangrovi]|uniref:Peptidase M23 n=1 Tax=Bacillus solimangrovi TaxID=1305675 RepID=A0A1E5LE01_9BACI|nr:peptidase M23 [Bacillus solimangrovi]